MNRDEWLVVIFGIAGVAILFLYYYYYLPSQHKPLPSPPPPAMNPIVPPTVAQPGPGTVGYVAAVNLAQTVSASTGTPTLVATMTDLQTLKTQYPGLLYLNSGDMYNGLILWAAYYVATGNRFDAGTWAWLAQYNPSMPQSLRGS